MKPRKKIVFYTMAMIKRGTERTIANLSNHFIKDYDITIITNINGPIEYELDKRIKVIPIDKIDKRNELLPKKLISKTSKKRSIRLKKIIKEEKPNLIITTLPEPTIRILSLKKDFKDIPIIVSIRNHPNSEFRSIIGKSIRNKCYKNANLITVQDNNYIKYLPKNLKIKVIPNYISDDFIKNNKDTKKEKIIITVASLEKQKNIPLLIESFSKLNNKYKDYKLKIIGKGKEKNKIKKLIKNKHLEDRIILKDTSNNIKDELLSSTLFVLPSNYEGMPNALLEAMSLQLPVITTNSTEALNSIIINNKNGIIIPKNNKKILTKKIDYILENKDIRNKLGKEATKVKEKYNKEEIINKWDKIIKEELN